MAALPPQTKERRGVGRGGRVCPRVSYDLERFAQKLSLLRGSNIGVQNTGRALLVRVGLLASHLLSCIAWASFFEL